MMRGNDNSDRNAAFQLNDIRVAFALLTRLPLPYPPFDAKRPAAMAAWAYPLVGVGVALLMILTVWGAMAFGLPAQIAALLALLTALLTTGAMHEDGLADCADGFWGGWTPEQRLEIMKDSQIGTYGVLGLLVSFGVRWQAVVLLIETEALVALFTVAVLSRAAMVWMMHLLPNARRTGLSQQTGRPTDVTVYAALGIGAASAVLSVGAAAIILVMLVGAVTFALSKMARSKIGGQTGDVLGATQQVVECVLLITLVALVHNS